MTYINQICYYEKTIGKTLSELADDFYSKVNTFNFFSLPNATIKLETACDRTCFPVFFLIYCLKVLVQTTRTITISRFPIITVKT